MNRLSRALLRVGPKEQSGSNVQGGGVQGVCARVYKGVCVQGCEITRGGGVYKGGEVTNEVWVSVRVLGIGRVMVRRVTEGRGS